MNREVVKEWVEVFKEERIHRGLSQRAVAARFGATSSHMSQWESGKVCPGVDSCARWARALGFDVQLARVVKR